MIEKIPHKEEGSVTNYWKKIPKKIVGVLGVVAIAMNSNSESLAQQTNQDIHVNYYSKADFKYQKEQILSYTTSNLLLYHSITIRIQNHLALLENTSKKEFRSFQKELEKGKEYSIITNKNTVPFEVVHILVGKDGKVLGTMIQQNQEKTMESFIDRNGDGTIDRMITDNNQIADLREKIAFAHQLIVRDVEDIAEQFTNKERKTYFPHHLIITDFSLSESQAEIISVDYNHADRPVGTKKSGDDTFINILEQSQRMHAGLTNVQNHLEKFTKENLITEPLVLR